MDYLKLFANHNDYEAYSVTRDKTLNNVSFCENKKHVHFNKKVHYYSKDYLTTVALESGSISFTITKNINISAVTSISYSTNNGDSWTTVSNSNNKTEHLVTTVNVNEGDKVLWKGDATRFSLSSSTYDEWGVGCYFSSTARFNVSGNLMSMCKGDNFQNYESFTNAYQIGNLFCAPGNYCEYDATGTSMVVSAENLYLPTGYTSYCYQHLLGYCPYLIKAPTLSATTLVKGCYYTMFDGCTSLTVAPELPATTMVDDCYVGMFFGCTSLTVAPELPATTMADGCYYNMFADCTSLTVAPELPATSLISYCYSDMFSGCTSLTTAPELPATTLTDNCYREMFKGCTNLNYIKAMFTTTPGMNYTRNWVTNVASSGTFVKNSAATWTTTGANGIPTGWTVQTASS